MRGRCASVSAEAPAARRPRLERVFISISCGSGIPFGHVKVPLTGRGGLRSAEIVVRRALGRCGAQPCRLCRRCRGKIGDTAGRPPGGSVPKRGRCTGGAGKKAQGIDCRLARMSGTGIGARSHVMHRRGHARVTRHLRQMRRRHHRDDGEDQGEGIAGHDARLGPRRGRVDAAREGMIDPSARPGRACLWCRPGIIPLDAPIGCHARCSERWGCHAISGG